jgi:DNA-binding MarR family transcriptional regulator
VEPDVTRGGGQGPYLAAVEAALAQVWARWEHLLDRLGGAVPAGQLRALLVIDASGASPVAWLAGALGISVSGADRLCDCLAAAGLVAWELAACTDQQLAVTVTEAGQRLAAWVRDQRRADLARGLAAMSAADKRALARGLSKLAAALEEQAPR